MKRVLILSFVIGMMFLGCSTKINMAEYRVKSVAKVENAPKTFKNTEHKAVVVKFDKKIIFNGIDMTPIAQSAFVSNLQSTGLIRELNIKDANQINEYIKLAEVEKISGNDNVLYHIIKGNLLSVEIVDNGTFHPSIMDKKGRIIRKACYSYEVCANMEAKVLLLPSKELEIFKSDEDCRSTCIGSRNHSVVNDLAMSAVKRVAIAISNDLKDVFTPKGYVYEYKENKDHELIAHITLGSKNGLKQNMKVYFYKVEKDSMGKKTLIKVAEGKVSQIIAPDNAWVVVEFEEGYQPKIGYIVKPVVKDNSILGRIGSFIKENVTIIK